MASERRNKENRTDSDSQLLFRIIPILCMVFFAGIFFLTFNPGFFLPIPKNHVSGILRIDVTSPITSLDPTATISAGSTYVFPLLYSVLAYPGEDGKLIPDVALRWTSEDEGRQWRILLRPDVVFHNGRPMNSADVASSIVAMTRELYPELNRAIREIDTSRENEILIKLGERVPFFFDIIASTDIVTPGSSEARDELVPLGSGPYCFEGRSAEGGVVLKAFDGFYGGKPSIEEIQFSHVPDSETAWYRLLFNETDAVFGISDENTRYSKHTGANFQVVKLGITHLYALFFNLNHPLLKNRDVRRAITASLDRRRMIDQYFEPETAVPLSGFFSPESVYHSPRIEPIAYDPSLLHQVLRRLSPAKDGADDGKSAEWELELLVPEGKADLAHIAREIQLALYAVGIKVRLKVSPLSDIIKKRLSTKKFESVVLGIRNVERNLESVWGGKPLGGLNYWGYRNEKLDDILQRLHDSTDRNMYVHLCREADEILSEDQPASFLYSVSVNNNIISNRVKNFSMHSAPAHYTILRKLSRSSLND